MALRSIAAVIAAVWVCASTAIQADVCERMHVGIHLSIDSSIESRRITGRLKEEAGAIWGTYGIQLEWLDAATPEPAKSRVSLDAIVERRFDPIEPAEGPTVLGRAVVKPQDQVWAPVRVSFDATQGVLALRTPVRTLLAGIVLDPELGRALGRVLAHEIGHVLLGAPNHDRTGLMRTSFRAEELGAPDRTPFRLTGRSVDRLRSRLRVLSGSW